MQRKKLDRFTGLTNREVEAVIHETTNCKFLAYFKFTTTKNKIHINNIDFPKEGYVLLRFTKSRWDRWINVKDPTARRFLDFCRRYNVPSTNNWLHKGEYRHIGSTKETQDTWGHYLHAIKFNRDIKVTDYHTVVTLREEKEAEEKENNERSDALREQSDALREKERIEHIVRIADDRIESNRQKRKISDAIATKIDAEEFRARSEAVDNRQQGFERDFRKHTEYVKKTNEEMGNALEDVMSTVGAIGKAGTLNGSHVDNEEKSTEAEYYDQTHLGKKYKMESKMLEIKGNKIGETHYGDIDVYTTMRDAYADPQFKVSEGGILGCTGGIAYLLKGMRTGPKCTVHFTQGFTDAKNKSPDFNTSIQKMTDELENVTLIDLTIKSEADGKKYQHIWVSEDTDSPTLPAKDRSEQIFHKGPGQLKKFREQIQNWFKASCADNADPNNVFVEVIRQAQAANGEPIKMSWTPGMMKHLAHTAKRDCILMFDNGGMNFKVTKKDGTQIITGTYDLKKHGLVTEVKAENAGGELTPDSTINTMEQVVAFVKKYIQTNYPEYGMKNVAVGYTGKWRENGKNRGNYNTLRDVYQTIYIKSEIDEEWINLVSNDDEGMYMGVLMNMFIDEYAGKKSNANGTIPRFSNKVCCEVSSSSGQFFKPVTKRKDQIDLEKLGVMVDAKNVDPKQDEVVKQILEANALKRAPVKDFDHDELIAYIDSLSPKEHYAKALEFLKGTDNAKLDGNGLFQICWSPDAREGLIAQGYGHLIQAVLGERRRLTSRRCLENRPIHMLAKLIQQAQA